MKRNLSPEERRAHGDAIRAGWAEKTPEQREAFRQACRDARAARRERLAAAEGTDGRPRITLADAVRESRKRTAAAGPARAVKGSRDARQGLPSRMDGPTATVRVQPGSDGPSSEEALAIATHSHGQATVLVSFPVESIAQAIGRELAAVLPRTVAPAPLTTFESEEPCDEPGPRLRPALTGRPVLAHADGEAIEILRLLIRIGEHRRDNDEGSFAHQQELFRTACAKAMRYRQDHPEMFA